MIGQTRAEYWFIRFCIIGLHYLAPLCILYCIILVSLYGVNATAYRFPLIVESIIAIETIFYLIYLWYRNYLQHAAVHPPTPSHEQRQRLVRLCNDNIPDPETYLQKWFLGADMRDIKRENLKEFFLWAFFNRGGPPGNDDEELEDYVCRTEKLVGHQLEKGTGTAVPLRLTLDQVVMLHRSFLWYLCVGFVDFLTYIKLLSGGFKHYRLPVSKITTLFPLRLYAYTSRLLSPAKNTTYWYRPHTSKTKTPVVFIHGIGIGLYPYTSFLSEINRSFDPDDQIGILVIEIMPISFRLTTAMLSRPEFCAEVNQIILHHLGSSPFVLASHSYGTVMATHLLSSPISPQISALVLIDPVCILLHLPDVAYNFTRRVPKEANEFQLWYFASMDPGVAHTLARRFFWNENILWKEDLAAKKMRTTVSLGGRDLIVNTEAVGRHLSYNSQGREFRYRDEDSEVASAIGKGVDRQPEMRPVNGEAIGDGDVEKEEWKSRAWRGGGIDVLWSKDLDHAQVFDTRAARKRLIDCILSYCTINQET